MMSVQFKGENACVLSFASPFVVDHFHVLMCSIIPLISFLASGGDVNARAGQSMRLTTMLHEAAAGGHDALVQLLLERGADPAALDDCSETPSVLAKAYGFHGTATLIKNWVAGVNDKKQPLSFVYTPTQAPSLPAPIRAAALNVESQQRGTAAIVRASTISRESSSPTKVHRTLNAIAPVPPAPRSPAGREQPSAPTMLAAPASHAPTSHAPLRSAHLTDDNAVQRSEQIEHALATVTNILDNDRYFVLFFFSSLL